MRKIEEKKVKEVLANVFKIKIENIDEATSMDTVQEWDSLNHLKLILALEDELDISFLEEETVEILSFELIKEVLKEHGIEMI